MAKMEVVFDQEAQAVDVKFDPKEFKTWEFVIAVLHAATEKAKIMMQMSQMQAAMVAQQNQQLARRIINGG